MASDAMGEDAIDTSKAMVDSLKIANQDELRLQRLRRWMQVSVSFLFAVCFL